MPSLTETSEHHRIVRGIHRGFSRTICNRCTFITWHLAAQDDDLCIIMEYADGGDLAKVQALDAPADSPSCTCTAALLSPPLARFHQRLRKPAIAVHQGRQAEPPA